MISRKNEADNCRGFELFFWRWRLFFLFRCLSKTGIQEPAGWAMSMCSIMKRAAKKSIKAAPVTSTCRESPIWWGGTTSTFMTSFQSAEPCLPTERSTDSAMFALLYPFWIAYIFHQSMHFSLDIESLVFFHSVSGVAFLGPASVALISTVLPPKFS